MVIKFKDGKEIEFKRFGNILLAESVIWEGTQLHGSLDKLRALKAKIAQWFDYNAPKKIREKYKARLPLWEEVRTLPLKDQLAYREGRDDQIADYFLGDEDNIHPAICPLAYFDNGYDSYYCYDDIGLSHSIAIRLCLEEGK